MFKNLRPFEKQIMDAHHKEFIASLNQKDYTQPEDHECHLRKKAVLYDDDLSDCECD